MEDRIDGVVLTFVDITRRKQAEESLRQSEEHYRVLFGQIDGGIAEVDLTGKFYHRQRHLLHFGRLQPRGIIRRHEHLRRDTFQFCNAQSRNYSGAWCARACRLKWSSDSCRKDDSSLWVHHSMAPHFE